MACNSVRYKMEVLPVLCGYMFGGKYIIVLIDYTSYSSLNIWGYYRLLERFCDNMCGVYCQ